MAIFGLSFLLASCIGAGVFWKSEVITIIVADEIKKLGGSGRVCPRPFEVGTFDVCARETGGVPTIDDIQKIWGLGDVIENQEDKKVIRYNTGLIWRGVFLIVVIVPVPLLIPVGHYHIFLTFRDNRLIQYSYEKNHTISAACGILSEASLDLSCEVER